MATARESETCHQQFPRNSSYLDHMTLLHLKHNYNSPRTTDFAYRGESDSVTRGLNTVQQDNVGGFLKSVPPYCNISYHPNQITSLKDSSQSSLINGIGLQDKAINDAPQKRLLIFDQCRNRTRLFFSPSFSPPNRAFASETPTSANGYGPRDDVATRLDEGFLMKPIVEEKWDENHLIDGDREMLEDTEEINALLYSDSDVEEDDDDENDEVTSTGQSPLSKKEFEELREEVASSDDSPKRRRLLDGNYNKSSSLASGERAISCNHEDDVESICAVDRNSYDDLDSCKRATKVKIRHALKMLESIVPGLSSKDPLSIIDQAIVYLKSMKIEAEFLGLRHSG